MRCPTCGGSGTELVASLEPYEYVACTQCRLTHVEPFPSSDEAEALFGDEYFDAAANSGYADYTADARLHRRNGRARVRRMGRPRHSGSRMVDVGCAWGYTMVEARAAGWEPLGVDVNEHARQAVAVEGMACAPSLPELELEPHSVDAVTYFQSLEHLPDPKGSLERARELLTDDGVVVVETWDRSSRVARLAGSHWQQLSPPSVLWLYDESTMARLASSVGLRLDSWQRSMKWVSLGLVLGQLVPPRGRWRSVVRGAHRIPLPYVLDDLVTARLVPA